MKVGMRYIILILLSGLWLTAMAGHADEAAYKEAIEKAEKRYQVQMEAIRQQYPNADKNPVAQYKIKLITQQRDTQVKQLAVEHNQSLPEKKVVPIGKAQPSKPETGKQQADKSVGKGRVISVSSGRSEEKHLGGGKTITEHHSKTEFKRDGAKEITSSEKTETTGLAGAHSSKTETRSVTTSSGVEHSKTESTSTSTGLTGTQTSSTSETVTKTGGSEVRKTNTQQTESLTATTGTETSAHTERPDGSHSSSYHKKKTVTAGGKAMVEKETSSTGKGQTYDVDVVDGKGNTVGQSSVTAGGSYTKETTKVGGYTVGRTDTVKGGLEIDVDRNATEDAPNDDAPQTPRTDVKIKFVDTIKVTEDADKTYETGGATQVGDAEFSGNIKLETGHSKHQQGTTITLDQDGNLTIEHGNEYEYNAIRLSSGGKADGKVGDAGFTLEGKGEVKAGGKAGYKGNVSISHKGVKSHGEAEIFAGLKAEGELAATIDLNNYIGLKFKGAVKGEATLGIGAKGHYDAELSWTKIKLSGGLAATLGVGTGGSGSVEIDAGKLITGVDLDAVKTTDSTAKIVNEIVTKVKHGEMHLPKNKKWSDILDEVRKKAEWLVKYPQLVKKGKEADAVMSDMKFQQGKKKKAFVSAKKHQQDSYCTNRPRISAPVTLPPVLSRD